MMKKFGVQFLALAMILLLAGSDVLGQTRVRFRRGTNSATLTGRLGVGGVRSYVLGARAGQSLTATLSSGNGRVDFTQGNIHDTQYSRILEYDGDVIITIDNHGGATNFTLTISIQ